MNKIIVEKDLEYMVLKVGDEVSTFRGCPEEVKGRIIFIRDGQETDQRGNTHKFATVRTSNGIEKEIRTFFLKRREQWLGVRDGFISKHV